MTIDSIETFVATPLYLLTPCRYPTKLTSRTLSILLSLFGYNDLN